MGTLQWLSFLKNWSMIDLYVGQETTVRTGHGTMDWFQIGKGVRQGCILSLCLFNFYAEYIMWNAKQMKHKPESRLPGEISITSDVQMTSPYGRKWRGTKEPLDESERGEWRAGLKLNIQKTKSTTSSPTTSRQIQRETMETVTLLFSWVSKSLWTVTVVMKLKDACSLVEKLWYTKSAY